MSCQSLWNLNFVWQKEKVYKPSQGLIILSLGDAKIVTPMKLIDTGSWNKVLQLLSNIWQGYIRIYTAKDIAFLITNNCAVTQLQRWNVHVY